MGAFEYLNNFYDCGLINKAIELNYSESNKVILSGDDIKLKNNYPVVYENLKSCRHNRDSRTIMQYGQDLVASWIFEDDLLKKLITLGLSIEGAGADRERQILTNSRVSSSSDFLISLNGREVKLELMTDYSGYWSKTKQLDLRDSKYLKMKRENSILLGISLCDSKYVVIDFDKEVSAEYIPRHFPYGNKPAYKIYLNKFNLEPLDLKQIAEALKEIIKMRP